jgi:hypothetical protein
MSNSARSLPDRPPIPYYLHNFCTALQWLLERYSDLLSEREKRFIQEFSALPWPSQALLVRLIMRKGPHFRASKIQYPEIASLERAIGPLVSLQWIDPRPLLDLKQLFRLVTRAEVAEMFPELPRGILKLTAHDLLREVRPEHRAFEEWRGSVAERVYFVSIASLTTQLKLLFFGNFRQDWSEFVLADLGVFKYEAVKFSKDSRAFQCRQDIEDFFALHECRRQFQDEVPLTEILARIPATRLRLEWLENRRAKLIFQIARAFERSGERERALELYSTCRYAGARLRAIRTLESGGRNVEALQLASDAAAQPESGAEAQVLSRVLARLRRRLNLPASATRHGSRPERLDLIVPAPAADRSVEQLAREHLAETGAPIYYVENALINSLFGLLCWDAIFAPVSGAFFHPFHVGPADLFSATFAARRKVQFDRCLARLESPAYQSSIMHRYREKRGTQSPFVSWGLLSEELVQTALACIPAAHLRLYFARLLAHLAENRRGLPDLIQFWIAEQRYRMIEVKGPGDRLQDNQLRWMDFCLQHGMPVAVCHVRWA